MTIGSLVAYLGIDEDDFNRGLDNAKKKLSSLTSTGATVGKILLGVGAGIASIGSGVGVVGGLAAALGTAAGAALVLPAAFAAVKLATAAATIGMEGFGEAISAADPEAFAAALEGLAPAARETAIAVRDQKAAWEELKLDVQQQLFEGMAKHVTRLGGTYLPILRESLRGVAADMNYTGQQTAKVFETPKAAGDVTTSLGLMREAIRNVLDIVPPLAAALLDVISVGAEFLPGLTSGAGDAAQRLADMVARMRETGELHNIIIDGMTVLYQFGQIAGNVGEIFGGIFGAANASGASFLDRLVLITQQLADMVNSAAGQEALTTFFATAATLSGLFMQALQILLPILPPLIEALGLVAINVGTLLVGALTAIAPYLQMFADWAAANPGLLTAVVVGLFSLIAAGQGMLALIGVINAVGAIWSSGLLQMAGRLLATVAIWVAQWTIMAVSAMARAATMAAAWLVSMGPVGAVIAIVVGLVALIIANWDSIVAWTTQAWTNVTAFITDAGRNIGAAVSGAVAAVVGFITNGWNNAVAWTQNAWNNLASAVRSGGENALAFVRGLPGMILNALSGLGGLLLGSGRALVDGFLSGIKGAWDRVVGFVRQGVQWVRDLFPFSPAKDGPFSGRGYVTHSGAALTGDFANSLRDGMPGVIASARALMAGAQAEMRPNLSAAASEVAVKLGSVSDGQWDQLRSMGYKGRAGDNQEALYVPRSVLDQVTGAGERTVTNNVEINNPVAERASDSVARELADLSEMGAFVL